ncbi:MAG TPA: hypothetical protein VLV83_07490 [Acidobacteriota bacterium]|nr:hypothetical protein [Acidobacteriota bacterium]
MTCIAAITDGVRVVMGGDSAGVDGEMDLSLNGPKVFEREGYLVGYADKYRAGQLVLSDDFLWPDPPLHPDARWASKALTGWLRACFSKGGWLRTADGRETSDANFLVGVAGKLFRITPTFAVHEAEEYAAIGCGAKYALGSFASTEGQPLQERVTTALRAAEKHCAGVQHPFTILTTWSESTPGAGDASSPSRHRGDGGGE